MQIKTQNNLQHLTSSRKKTAREQVVPRVTKQVNKLKFVYFLPSDKLYLSIFINHTRICWVRLWSPSACLRTSSIAQCHCYISVAGKVATLRQPSHAIGKVSSTPYAVPDARKFRQTQPLFLGYSCHHLISGHKR